MQPNDNESNLDSRSDAGRNVPAPDISTQQSTQQPSNSGPNQRESPTVDQNDRLISAIDKLSRLVEDLTTERTNKRRRATDLIDLENRSESTGNRSPSPLAEQNLDDDLDVENLQPTKGNETEANRTHRTLFEDAVSDVALRTPNHHAQPLIIEMPHTIQPPKFNGDRANARTWLNEYDNIMNANSVPDAKKVVKARAFLTDYARSWFNVTESRMPNMDWPTFKRQFVLDFCGPDAMAQLRRKLDATTQKSGEHPNEYAVRLLDLCIQLNPKMPESERVDRIMRGLRIETRNILSCINPHEDWQLNTLLNLLAAQRVEHRSETSQTQPENQNLQSSKTATTSSDSKKPMNLKTWECFNCGQKGHDIPECKAPLDEARVRARRTAFRAEKEAQRTQEKVVGSLGTTPKPAKIARLPCDDQPKPRLIVEINGRPIGGRVDSGADMTVIPSDVAEELKLPILPWNSSPLTNANQSPIEIIGMASAVVAIDNVYKPILVAVIPRTSLRQILWGNDLLRAFNLKLDFSKDSTEITVPTHIDVDDRATNSIETAESQHPVDQVKIGKIDESNKSRLVDTLVEYGDVFSRNEEDIGRTSLIKHRILLTSDLPIHKRRYQVSYKLQPKMESIIERMKSSGVIRDSVSPYAAPGFMVDKEGGKDKRLVADYRPLNAITIPDRTPMPHPEDVFSMLAGMKIFAKLDITAMFNQIAVDERDVAKTAMTTHFGLFEFVTMPFGLKNAPATAVRLMREVLRGLDEKTCYVYFDDIIIFAESEGQLVQRCTEVITRLRQHNLKLKPSKCIFGTEEVSFLGHIISARGVDVDPKRIEHVKKFPIPRNPTDVRSFYGLCSYNRKFIHDFAKISKPLTPLMNIKPSEFVWTIDAQEAFETLRGELTSAPTLVHFNPDAEHELRTDASSYAIGAVLYQKHEDKVQTGVVLYYSKMLNQAQRNYSATERELLAAFNSITTLKHYLLGKRFILVTDHAVLSMLRNHRDPHQRLARWIAQLMAFDFEVRYKTGITHKDADCLSRLVAAPEPNDDDDAEKDVDVDDLIDPVEVARSNDFIRAICSVSSQLTDDLTPQEDANIADIRKEQREDQFCNRYIQILEDDTLSAEEKSAKAYGFMLQDGKLYRCQVNGNNVLAVPARRRAAVLLSCHDCPLGGHLGFQKTLSQIKTRFYWPKMRRDIKRHIQTCVGCQLRKPPNSRRQGLTMPLPIAEDVFDTIGVDLIVKLPLSPEGFNTLLVCTDNLSKYAIVVPLKNELGSSIRHAFFNHVISKFGCPKLVITDQGANLISNKSKDFFDLFGIKKQRTSAFHPQSNGQTERFNRTLAASLTIFIERNQRDWPEFVQAITFAYNISEHSVTRTSPYEMVFGRQARIPIENILGRDVYVDPDNLQSGARSIESIQLMKKLIAASQQANKRRLDRRLAKCTFKEGDVVVVERPSRVSGGTHKLSYVYVGPFTIKRKLGDLSFELEKTKAHTLKSYVVHPCHLRKFHCREGDVADDLVDPTFITREQVETVDISEDTDTSSEIDVDLSELPMPPVLSPHCADQRDTLEPGEAPQVEPDAANESVAPLAIENAQVEENEQN